MSNIDYEELILARQEDDRDLDDDGDECTGCPFASETLCRNQCMREDYE